MNRSHEELLREFPPQSRDEWEQRIAEDCQGTDIEKNLIWKTPENIRVKAFYCAEDISNLSYLENLSAKYRKSTTGNLWDIRQDIKVVNYKEAGERAACLTKNGVEAPGFDIRGVNPGADDYKALLQDIDTSKNRIHWIADETSMIDHLSKLVQSGERSLSGSSCVDPLGRMISGSRFESGDLDNAGDILRLAAKNLPFMKVISVNGIAFSNAGASVVQELAFCLSAAAEYFSIFTEMGISPGTIAQHIKIDFGISGNYFFEIARIRAARILWDAMLSGFYDNAAGKKHQVHIQSTTSLWNKTVYESHVNILRTTTEAMSAILGGCDTIMVHGYDECYREPGDHSLRIARNIPLILQEESNFHKVADPSAGSYYIEYLTDLICQKAWDLFLEAEKYGGFIKAFNSGMITEEIRKTAEKRIEAAASARDTILGTNAYPNPLEVMAGKTEKKDTDPFPYPLPTGTKFLRPARASEAFEKLRLAAEKHAGKRPGVFLLTYGNPAISRVRSQFSANFFAAGGYEIIDPGFRTPEEGVSEALSKNADIIVACSSDDEYTSTVPLIKMLAADKATVVVAGAPECMDDLKNAGVRDFIYSGMNMIEALAGYHRKMNIKF